MAWLARVVAIGLPHRVTQRGNRRQQVFFSDAGCEVYRTLLAEGCQAADGTGNVWASLICHRNATKGVFLGGVSCCAFSATSGSFVRAASAREFGRRRA